MQIANAGIVPDWLDCASYLDGVEHRLGEITRPYVKGC